MRTTINIFRDILIILAFIALSFWVVSLIDIQGNTKKGLVIVWSTFILTAITYSLIHTKEFKLLIPLFISFILLNLTGENPFIGVPLMLTIIGLIIVINVSSSKTVTEKKLLKLKEMKPKDLKNILSRTKAYRHNFKSIDRILNLNEIDLGFIYGLFKIENKNSFENDITFHLVNKDSYSSILINKDCLYSKHNLDNKFNEALISSIDKVIADTAQSK